MSQTCCSILSFSRDMQDTLDEDHRVIIEEHSSQLQQLLSTKSGGLLDELVQRNVISSAHQNDIMVSISGSYYYYYYYYFMFILTYINHSLLSLLFLLYLLEIYVTVVFR